MEAATLQDKSKPLMSQAHLLTPESPLLDSFSQSVSVPQKPQQAQAAVTTPPASPQFDQRFQKDYDEQLFPDSATHNDTILPPLFDQNRQTIWASRQRTPPIERALSNATIVSPKLNSAHTAPRKRVVDLVGPVALYNHYGNEYYEFMLAQMEDHRSRMRSRTLPAPKALHGDRNIYDKTVLRSLGSNRVEKPRTVTRTVPVKTKPVRPTSSRGVPVMKSPVPTTEVFPAPVRRGQTPKRPARVQRDSPDAVSGAASKRTRAAPTKKLDGKIPSQWAELEDFCPPIDSLDNAGTELSVVWNNASALNLDTDVDRVHLHPQELKIASKLRLHCNEYLLNKRRIFAAKVRSLQEGTVFNKTSAQNATSVDVNKASRLWSAFDGAGWFEPLWFEEWL